MSQPMADTVTALIGIDHLAIRVVDPDALARFLCDHCGMERTDSDEGFLVLGAPGGRTRLFLFEAEETPDPGVLERVVLRVSDLESAVATLPDAIGVEHIEPGVAVFAGPQGLALGLTSVLGGGVDYDIDHFVLRVMSPDETTIALAELGFVPSGGALHVADKHVRVEPGIRSAGDNELLDHIGVLVESVEALKGQALRGGLEFDELTLCPNRLGIYVRGLERLRVEYAEPR
jgi:catechol 2,3-dioxygenase-like lactoylglutathione lyase family enzyme